MDGQPQTPESGLFRFVIGFMALGGALGGFFALFWIEIPARNENALLLALGFVMGWAGAVIASEYGATTVGRKVAESAVRNLDRQNVNDSPPDDIKEAAQDTADAAQKKADTIKGEKK